jgi:hypothetical protein
MIHTGKKKVMRKISKSREKSGGKWRIAIDESAKFCCKPVKFS